MLQASIKQPLPALAAHCVHHTILKTACLPPVHRIRHTIILDDPYDDPPQLEEHIPDASPEPAFEQGQRLEDDWVPADDTRPVEEVEEETRKHEAQSR